MKILITLMAVAAFAVSASAQGFVSGPVATKALTVSTVFRVPGNTTTNVPLTLAPVFQGGRDGVGISALAATTNAASSTNFIITIKPLVNGVVGSPSSYSVSASTGNGNATPYYTNIASSAASLLNAPGFVVTSIQNTNADTLFITNITAYTR